MIFKSILEDAFVVIVVISLWSFAISSLYFPTNRSLKILKVLVVTPPELFWKVHDRAEERPLSFSMRSGDFRCMKMTTMTVTAMGDGIQDGILSRSK